MSETLTVAQAFSRMAHNSMTPAQRKARASKAGKASWSRLTAPQRKDRAKRAARNRKPSSVT